MRFGKDCEAYNKTLLSPFMKYLYFESSTIELVKSVMGLFSEFPLNVMLVAGLCFVAFRLFGAARHAV